MSVCAACARSSSARAESSLAGWVVFSRRSSICSSTQRCLSGMSGQGAGMEKSVVPPQPAQSCLGLITELPSARVHGLTQRGDDETTYKRAQIGDFQVPVSVRRARDDRLL